MHYSSYQRMRYFYETYLNPNDKLKILDIGSFDRKGDYNYGNLITTKNWTYHGLDLKKGNNVDIVVENPYDWAEIEDETYDVVISGQAFEHIEFFWLTLEQIDRVLKPGGMVCIIVPSTGPVHRNPYDCYRFGEDAMKAMAKYINLRILETGTNTEKEPWFDSHLIAKKAESGSIDELENKMDTLERKLDIIMSKLDI